MATWNPAELMALKSANPIVEVARDLGLEVIRQRFRCPRPERHAHGDRTPSVSLSPDRGTFKCWVCPEVKGDVIDLVRLVKGIGFSEALEFLSTRSGNRSGNRSSSGRDISKPHGHAGNAGHAAQVGHAGNSVSPSQIEMFPAPIETPPTYPVPLASEASQAAPEALEQRRECLAAFLSLCRPVQGKAASWLRKRRIFRKTWIAQQLKVVDDYGKISDRLRADFSLPRLQASGLFNPEGHLRFYRHPLLLPYLDAAGAAVYLQARALEPDFQPKELSLRGNIPCPYNVKLLDGEPGPVYLCEGVIDTLTLLEAGFKAVGVPGASNFKAEWVPLFAHKSVYIAFDADAAGEAGTAKAVSLLSEGGIEAHRVAIPPGKDINEWLSPG